MQRKVATSSKKIKKTPTIKSLLLSAHVRRNVHFLEKIAGCKKNPKRCAQLIAEAGAEQLLCIVECCLNLLRGRVAIRGRRLEHLRPYAAQIRAISRARCAKRAKSQLEKEQQSGRGVPLLPLIVGSILPVIVDQIFNKA